MRYSLKVAVLFCGFLTVGTMGQAQDKWVKGLPGDVDLDVGQLFSIFTSGFQAANPSETLIEFGTGFAVAPKVVITAGHVTRDGLQFDNKANDDKIHIPDRDVELSFAVGTARRDEIDKTIDVIVTPSPLVNTDAASLTLFTGTVNPLPLSVCEIERGQTYYLLKFSQDGTTKKKNVPVAVQVKPSDDVAARLGNLVRFEHTIVAPDNEARPIGGDSGSPILDAEGHVVGLLTAVQGSSYLWVTPTLSFLDLVPPAVKQSVRCKDNIEVTNVVLAETKDAVSAVKGTVETLRGGISENVGLIGNLRTEFNALLEDYAEKILLLEDEIVRLKESDTKLATKDLSLEETDGQLKGNIDETSMRSTAVLAAMIMSVGDQGAATQAALDDAIAQINKSDPDITFALVEKAFEQMKNSNPVIPAMSRMNREFKRVTNDLGVPRWRFEHRVGSDPSQPKQPHFLLKYERSISAPLVSDQLGLCMRPMLELQKGAKPRGRERDYDIGDTNFYLLAEERFVSGDEYFTNCAIPVFPFPKGIKIAKSASYKFTINTDQSIEADHLNDLLVVPEVVDRFYAYVFDSAAVKDERWDNAVLHRFIFEVDREGDKPELSCYYFKEPQEENPDKVDVGDTMDTLAEFAGLDDEKDREKFRCRTFTQ